MNQNCSKTQKCSNFSTIIVVKPRNVVFVDTLLVEKILHFELRILLHFWLNNYYKSGFYYESGWKVTTFLVLLHFWLFTTFLGLTVVHMTRESEIVHKKGKVVVLRLFSTNLYKGSDWLTGWFRPIRFDLTNASIVKSNLIG